MEIGRSIGIFDSGYGGLTILKDIVRELPDYDYIYLGDNARTPYGTRSYDVVYKYTRQAVETLFEMGCRLVLLACNTASAKALRTIQQVDLPRMDPGRRVLGVIRPSVESLAGFTRNGHIGIMATPGTVTSGSYLLEIEKLYPGKILHVTQEACPMWVPLVENDEQDSIGAAFFVQRHVSRMLNKDPEIDTVILACTHYPLLGTQINHCIPAGVIIVEQGALVARSLRDYLQRHPEIERQLSRQAAIHYNTTESAEIFDRVGSRFMEVTVQSKQITMDEIVKTRNSASI